MGEYKEKKREQPEPWRTSQGRLRQARPTPKKEGRDHQTGYESHPQEQDRPRESGRLESSFGNISVGSSRKKELTVVLSKRRRQEGLAVTEDERVMKAGGARRLKSASGNFFTNVADRESSAVAYRASHRKPPGHMLARFREMLAKHGPQALDEQVPFLDREPEQRELRTLTQQARTLREAREDAMLRQAENRKEELHQVLTEKKTQEGQLQQLLRKAQAESRKRAAGEWDPLTLVQEITAQPPEDPEEQPEDPPQEA